MFSLPQKSVITLKPESKKNDDASDHDGFSFVIVWQVNLDFILQYSGVNPHQNLHLMVEKDHVFVDDEVTITEGEALTGDYYCASVGKGVLGETELL